MKLSQSLVLCLTSVVVGRIVQAFAPSSAARARTTTVRSNTYTSASCLWASNETEISATNPLELSNEELDEIESSSMFLTASTTTTSNEKILPAETLISIAKRFLMKSKGIGGDGELLSESFVFEGPVVGPLGKEEFVEAIGQVDFEAGFPDWKAQFYNFQVDVFDPERVWYMAKGEGTNTGPFPTKDSLPATYKKVINPPQICSLTIDPNTGLIKKYTIGYVADRNVGNTGGLGGLYGILYAIGRPLPFPEALPWKPSLPYQAFQKLGGLMRKLQK